MKFCSKCHNWPVPLNEDLCQECAESENEEIMNDIENRFTYHPPKNDQATRYEYLRDRAHDLAGIIDQKCPDSREKSTAIMKLEECVFWANASIARNE